ncbi:MAG TPA: gliding motility-associated C-terminal domain-containing protein, partial [Ferruginibacter sp.]|nr:gliding motility-associated C-terminal domain-containing protein [Ferruginibacter sp.]
ETFRPIPIGMRSITIFRVYNRWGQLIFTERGTNEGWNGRVKGVLQDAGSYVWYAEGITYQGRKISRKGSVILIK